jgi:hypothetical protein
MCLTFADYSAEIENDKFGIGKVMVAMRNTGRYLFFSLAGFSHSRGAVYLNAGEGLMANKSEFIEVSGRFWRDFPRLPSIIQSIRSQRSNVVVLSPSHLLVPLIKFISRKRIILDAGWSLTEAEVARWQGLDSLPKILKCIIIDFIAFKFASKIIVETNQQKIFISSRFLVRKNKIIVLMTGCDEVVFNVQSNKPLELANSNQTLSFPIVFFRGSYTNEAGFELLSEVSKKLEDTDIKFIISTNRIPKEIIFGKNTILISRRISNNEMKYLYEKATVCIGQITNRPRLKNTIPHKAFEAAYFRKPYVSADALGIREFLPDNSQCYYLEALTVECLEKAIIKIVTDSKLQSELSFNIAKRYKEVSSQATLSLKFFEIISS